MAIAVLTVLCLPCSAAEDTLEQELGVDSLTRAAEQYDTGVEFSAGLTLNDGLRDITGRALKQLPQVLRSGVKSSLLLLVVVILGGLVQSVQATGTGREMPVAVMAGALAITGLAANDMSALLGLGRSTINDMQGFGQALLPVMAACTAAAGSVGSAAARQIATALFSNLIMTLIDRLLVPLLYAYVAASTACAAVGNQGLKRVAELLKWVVNSLLTAILIGFVSYLSLSGVLAGTADAAALKATKMAISSAVPVVGGIISNAAETVLVGAGVLKNTVGLFGMLAVLGLCLTPFLRLGVHYLAYKFCAALAATLADPRLADLIGSIGSAFGLILGMTGSCALMLLVSMLSGIVGVGT